MYSAAYLATYDLMTKPTWSGLEIRQDSVRLQPDSGLFNSLGAGVVKLTTIKMVKTKQFNSLSFIFLFNQLQSVSAHLTGGQFHHRR